MNSIDIILERIAHIAYIEKNHLAIKTSYSSNMKVKIIDLNMEQLETYFQN